MRHPRHGRDAPWHIARDVPQQAHDLDGSEQDREEVALCLEQSNRGISKTIKSKKEREEEKRRKEERKKTNRPAMPRRVWPLWRAHSLL